LLLGARRQHGRRGEADHDQKAGGFILYSIAPPFLKRKATCVNHTGGFFLPGIIDKTMVMWYDIFKNSTAARKIDEKESE